MRFSTLLVSSLIIEPLRYFFGNYTNDQGLKWDPDDKVRTIEIGTVNDYNTIKIGANPRILVNRGTFMISKAGLTDNLAESKGTYELKGASNRINKVEISGMSQIVIEARNEGTCELIADMVSHFIIWTRPLLCDTQGFREFGLNMQVSDCQADREDTEKFKTVITVPYITEEHWKVDLDSLKLKGFFLELQDM